MEFEINPSQRVSNKRENDEIPNCIFMQCGISRLSKIRMTSVSQFLDQYDHNTQFLSVPTLAVKNKN
jgi:hypothetical protein